jgi:hypothetical protein
MNRTVPTYVDKEYVKKLSITDEEQWLLPLTLQWYKLLCLATLADTQNISGIV